MNFSTSSGCAVVSTLTWSRAPRVLESFSKNHRLKSWELPAPTINVRVVPVVVDDRFADGALVSEAGGSSALICAALLRDAATGALVSEGGASSAVILIKVGATPLSKLSNVMRS